MERSNIIQGDDFILFFTAFPSLGKLLEVDFDKMWQNIYKKCDWRMSTMSINTRAIGSY
jgi:hypothetical protein